MGILRVATISPAVLPVALVAIFIVACAGVLSYLFRRPSFPQNAPGLSNETIPILGSVAFFTRRWDFCQRQKAKSKTGYYSFYAGAYPIVGLSGEFARKIFFEHKGLSLAEGYGALLGGSPKVTEENNVLAETRERDSDFNAYLTKRLANMLKGPQLQKNLPHLLRDTRANLDALAAGSNGTTDPFDSIYRIVFQITMRTLACNEIADDARLRARVLQLFETIEGTASPLSIMFPWMPLPSKFKRIYAGMQLYMIFKKVMDDRTRSGRREDDALQYLMDQGDDITSIITFVLGALFAGQVNSGINAAYILCYLSLSQEWYGRVREEVNSVADRYCSDKSLPLKDRLMQVPIEAWEGEFPVIDLCLKDTIRLQLSGAAFRQNISGHEIPLGKNGEAVPAGAYAVLPAGEMHYDPEIYTNPDEWDPARYLPERAEDKKQPYAWMGWGLGRHPCMGMRFAKLETNVITALFLAYFDDVQLVDAKGNPRDRVPPTDRNNITARKPDADLWLKFRTSQA